ncbi:hypothetical protein NBRC116587_33950 [Pseudoteredinibacter isoporae]
MQGRLIFENRAHAERLRKSPIDMTELAFLKRRRFYRASKFVTKICEMLLKMIEHEKGPGDKQQALLNHNALGFALPV